MAEANFNEVLGAVFDVSSFVSSLNEAAKAYENFISGLDEQTKKGFGTGLTSGVNSSIQDLSSSLNEFRKDLIGSIAQLETNITAVFSKLDSSVDTTTKQAKTKLKEVTQEARDALIAANELALGAGKDKGPIAAFKTTGAERVRQEIEAEQNRVEVEAVETRVKIQEDSAAKIKQIYFKQQEEMAAATLARLKEEEAAQIKADEEFAALGRKQNAEAFTRQQQRAALIKSVEDELTTATNKRIALEQKAAEAKQAALNKQLSAQEEALRLEQQILAQQERNNELKQGTAIAEVSGSKLDNIRQRAVLLKQAIEDAKRKINELIAREQAIASQGGFASTERLNILKQIGEETSKLNTRLAQYGSITEASEKAAKGFFDRWTHGLVNTFSLLTRYFLVFTALNAVLDAFKFTIGAPFEILADGVTFMRQIQEAAIEMSGVLASNVTFSKDLAENFKIASEVSVDLVKLLRERAVVTGTPFEALNATFKALLQGGAFQTVSTLRELTTLAETFQLSLRAAGAGGLAAQGSIQEISKLFSGIPGNYNKFLAALKLTPAEWVRIRDEALKHRNLLELLPDSLKNYINQVQLAQISQERLAKAAKDLIDKIGGEGGAGLFQFITQTLKNAVEFLERNFNKVVGIVTIFSESIRFALNEFISFAAVGETSLDPLFKTLLTLNELVLIAISEFTLLGGAVFDTFSLMYEASKGPAANFKDLKKTFDSLLSRPEKFKDDLKEIIAISDKATKAFNRIGNAPTLLNDTFGANPPAGNPVKQLSSIISAFELEKQKYLNAVEDIQEASKRTREKIQQDLVDRTISQTEATKRVTEDITKEIASLDVLRNAFRQKFLDAIQKVGSDAGASPEERSKAQLRILRELEQFERQEKKRRSALVAEQAASERAAGKERVAIQKDSTEATLKKEEELIRSRTAFINLARQTDTLTEVEYADRLEEIAQDTFNIQVKRIQELITATATGSRDRLKLEQDLNLARLKFANEEDERTAQRLFIRERESQAIRDYLLALKQVDIQSKQNILSLSAELSPEKGFSEVISQSIRLRRQELDLIEKNLEKQLELAASKNAESETTRRLTLELSKLRNERNAVVSAEIQALLSGTQGLGNQRVGLNRIAANESSRRLAALEAARAKLNTFDSTHEFGTDIITNAKLASEREHLVAEIHKLSDAFADFEDTIVAQVKPSFRNFGKNLADVLFGKGAVEAFKLAKANGDKNAQAVAVADAAASALANVVGIIENIKQGIEQGGLLGGVGAGISSLGNSFSFIPVIGPFLPAIGGVLSLVGKIFGDHSRKIAEDAKKNFQLTLDNFQNGNANLVDTLKSLEAQRLDAIAKLSNSKTGKKELEKLLPEFDNQIRSLKEQQKQIVDNFNESLLILRDNSGVLSDVRKKWQDINKQVKDYIGAGGDAAKAAEFLSLNLQKIQKDAADQLASAEQEALQEAIKYNDLLIQRQKIVDEFNQKEFDAINKNAIERRNSNVVQTANDLNKLRKDRDDQLAAIDAEISLENRKLDKQKEIFNLAGDLASLKRRDEELTLRALDAQLQKLKDLRDLANSITLGANGLFSSSLLGNSNININITGLTPDAAGAAVADSVAYELERRFRLGPSVA